MVCLSQQYCDFWSKSSYMASLSQPSCGQYIKAILMLFCASHPMASLSQPSCYFWSWPSCGLRVSVILWLFVSAILWPVCPSHHVACFLQPSYGFLSWSSCGLSVPAIIWPVCPSYLVASILKPSCGLSVPAILWPVVVVLTASPPVAFRPSEASLQKPETLVWLHPVNRMYCCSHSQNHSCSPSRDNLTDADTITMWGLIQVYIVICACNFWTVNLLTIWKIKISFLAHFLVWPLVNAATPQSI